MEFTKDIEFNSNPTANQEIILNYHGIFKNCAELTIVYGFGEFWHQTTETPMTKTESGFSVKIKMLDFDTFNFCFRNSNQQWDNNNNCNYITSILPCLATPEQKAPVKFDIDALIEEILQPIITNPSMELEMPTPIQISSKPIDLGLEISNALSQITFETPTENLPEYCSLDEILAGTVFQETTIELFQDDPIVNLDLEVEPAFAVEEIPMEVLQTQNISNIQEDLANLDTDFPQKQTALITTKNAFMISPRKLSKFYTLKKHIKLAFYKLFVKLPKLIFGPQEQ